MDQAKPNKPSQAGLYVLLIVVLVLVLGAVLGGGYFLMLKNKELTNIADKVQKNENVLNEVGKQTKMIGEDIKKLDRKIEEAASITSTETTTGEKKTFQMSVFPFTFEYDSGWTLIKPGEEIKYGENSIKSEKNEIKLINPAAKNSMDEQLKDAEGTDVAVHSIAIQFFKEKKVDELIKDIKGQWSEPAKSISESEKKIGDYNVKTIKEEGLYDADLYFLQLGNDTIYFEAVADEKGENMKMAEAIITSLK